MIDNEPENKIVLVGDMGVGKTTIIRRFTTGVFDTGITPTVGAGSVHASVKLNDDSIIDLTIWDTAGQERYQSLIPLYLRKAKGVILVCDLTAKHTIQTLNVIFTSLTNVDSDCVMMLVGNKIDIDTASNFTPLKKWADEHNMSFMTVSAKTGIGINEMFTSIANSIMKTSTDNKNLFKQKTPKKPSGCCF